MGLMNNVPGTSWTPRSGHPTGARHAHHVSLCLPVTLDPRTTSSATAGESGLASAHPLPRLDTQGLSGMDDTSGLRTAPSFGGFLVDHDPHGSYTAAVAAAAAGAGPGSTINPAHLILTDSPTSYTMFTPTSPFFPGYAETSGDPAVMMNSDDPFRCWTHPLDGPLPYLESHEQAVDESSPSAWSAASHGTMGEVMLDGSHVLAPVHGPSSWMIPPTSSSSTATATAAIAGAGATTTTDDTIITTTTTNNNNNNTAAVTVSSALDATMTTAHQHPHQCHRYHSPPQPTLLALYHDDHHHHRREYERHDPSSPPPPPPHHHHHPFSLDPTNNFIDVTAVSGTTSPKHLHTEHDVYAVTHPPPPQPMTGLDDNIIMTTFPHPHFHPPMLVPSETSPPPLTSVEVGSERPSLARSSRTDSITEMTRQSLITGLRLSPSESDSVTLSSSPTTSSSVHHPAWSDTLPSASDLQRYVMAYMQHFHPHLPFLHLPTLSFDAFPPDENGVVVAAATTTTTTTASSASSSSSSDAAAHASSAWTMSGGCLILAMAAIGAWYELEVMASQQLAEAAQQAVRTHLDRTPLARDMPIALIQALLLNIVYGHNCGDEAAVKMATAQWAVLIGVVREAELTGPSSVEFGDPAYPAWLSSSSSSSSSPARPMMVTHSDDDVQMSGHDGNGHGGGLMMDVTRADDDGWIMDLPTETSPLDLGNWHAWARAEERKRTLYAIYTLPSFLGATDYFTPALNDVDIKLDLPGTTNHHHHHQQEEEEHRQQHRQHRQQQQYHQHQRQHHLQYLQQQQQQQQQEQQRQPEEEDDVDVDLDLVVKEEEEEEGDLNKRS